MFEHAGKGHFVWGDVQALGFEMEKIGLAQVRWCCCCCFGFLHLTNFFFFFFDFDFDFDFDIRHLGSGSLPLTTTGPSVQQSRGRLR